MVLQPATSQLGGVTVTARKPFIQKLSDRIVVNVENSIVSAGSSAMEVLERSPGVNIDQNDAISLKGKQGVIIMIDGKPTPMTGSDLANYLRGLPSAAIERIDIITNQSAKYDAAGNSGIIDIRMKKDQRMGANGTFTAGYGQGVYPKANTGTSFSYCNKKINVFGNYNYSYRVGLNHLLLFPSVFFNYKITEDKTLGISVGRRTDRPGYSKLNPFLFLIDVTTYATGRPGLLPQLTWSYELSYTRKNLNFTTSYSHTVNNQNIAIAKFREVFPNIPSAENVTVQIPINLASSDYLGLGISAPVRINKWWNMINNADLYYENSMAAWAALF